MGEGEGQHFSWDNIAKNLLDPELIMITREHTEVTKYTFSKVRIVVLKSLED